MKNMDRYHAEPLRLYDLMNEFLVHCPKCDGRAKIKIPQPFDYKNGTLKCKSCHFSQKANDLIRYRLGGKAKCNQCLKILNIATIVEYKSIPTYVNIRCNSCQTINKVSENWESYILKYQDSGIIDPAFGLPLWYQDIIKGNIIWAYNLRHLTEIKHYVQATLRERTTDKFKMTMVEKLPDFIKFAKNREEILKTLTQMLER